MLVMLPCTQRGPLVSPGLLPPDPSLAQSPKCDQAEQDPVSALLHVDRAWI